MYCLVPTVLCGLQGTEEQTTNMQKYTTDAKTCVRKKHSVSCAVSVVCHIVVCTPSTYKYVFLSLSFYLSLSLSIYTHIYTYIYIYIL